MSPSPSSSSSSSLSTTPLRSTAPSVVPSEPSSPPPSPPRPPPPEIKTESPEANHTISLPIPAPQASSPPSRSNSIISTTSSRTDSFFSRSFQPSETLTPPKPLNGTSGGARSLARAGSIGRAGLDVPSVSGRLTGLGAGPAGRSPNHPRSVSDASYRHRGGQLGGFDSRPYFSFEKESQGIITPDFPLPSSSSTTSLSSTSGFMDSRRGSVTRDGHPNSALPSLYIPSKIPPLGSRLTPTSPSFNHHQKPGTDPSAKQIIPDLKEGDILIENPTLENEIDRKAKWNTAEDRTELSKRSWRLEGSELGKGAFSRVWGARCIGEDTRGLGTELVAVKLMTKEACLGDDRMFTSFTREVEILKKINHPAIMTHIASFATFSHYCLVLPFISGGELFSTVEEPSKWGMIGRGFVKRVWKELEGGVSFLHSHGIVHRDIKLENVLLTSPLPSPVNPPRQLSKSILPPLDQPLIKLTDFGLAKEFSLDNFMLTTRCGSDSYAAPEIILGKSYDGRLTDSWACGVVLFALLTRSLPFGTPPHDDPTMEPSSTRRSRMLRIAKGEFSWPPVPPTSSQSSISLDPGRLLSGKAGSEAKALVDSLLTRDPTKRGMVGGLGDKWVLEDEGDWEDELGTE
ncbi:kinase-like protein [Phaffia rhodozyma]|uniref:Kinase-like protein n=1 Tax=Phaffia rhodozyma TaxID=264483 RepID=A0A0F7SF87_PHARH|nr:kinase-like protein [Phaffia rhodozyma]